MRQKDLPKEKCVDNEDLPQEKWKPVSNIPDPYENAPEKVKIFHKEYVKLWLTHLKRDI